MITTIREKGLRMEVPMDASHADSLESLLPSTVAAPFVSFHHLLSPSPRYRLSTPFSTDRRAATINPRAPRVSSRNRFTVACCNSSTLRLLLLLLLRHFRTRMEKCTHTRTRERITIARREHLGREEKGYL